MAPFCEKLAIILPYILMHILNFDGCVFAVLNTLDSYIFAKLKWNNGALISSEYIM